MSLIILKTSFAPKSSAQWLSSYNRLYYDTMEQQKRPNRKKAQKTYIKLKITDQRGREWHIFYFKYFCIVCMF